MNYIDDERIFYNQAHALAASVRIKAISNDLESSNDDERKNFLYSLRWYGNLPDEERKKYTELNKELNSLIEWLAVELRHTWHHEKSPADTEAYWLSQIAEFVPLPPQVIETLVEVLEETLEESKFLYWDGFGTACKIASALGKLHEFGNNLPMVVRALTRAYWSCVIHHYEVSENAQEALIKLSRKDPRVISLLSHSDKEYLPFVKLLTKRKK